MSFDALAMHAVRDELEATILGGHVEKVLPLSDLEVGLRVRAQHRDFNLLISADAQVARVHLVRGTLRRLSEDVTPFLLLMRKYVRDGQVVSIEQPALERVIVLAVENRQEDGSSIASSLIIEIMGRHSNAILVGEDGKVLDAIKRVPPSLSRQRPVLPHLLYNPPPAQEKLNPLLPTLASQLASSARQAPPSSALWRLLQEAIAGLGPLSAREVAHRACGEASIELGRVDRWEDVASALAGLFAPLRTHEWSPCVVVENGAVIHFAPHLLTQFPNSQVERVESMSEAVERAHAERLRLRPAESLRAPLRSSLEGQVDRVRRKEGSLHQALSRGAKAEELKGQGQAILASVAAIATGQEELQWEGKAIKLDPTLSPAENAQRYFREYAKARDAAREIPALLEAARLEREYLEQMLAHVEAAKDDVELRALSRELAETAEGASTGTGGTAQGRGRTIDRRGKPAGKQGKHRAEPAAGTVKRFTSADGHQILVGGSAKGNERVTFQLGGESDLWLHARGTPGAHVIVKSEGRDVPRSTLLEAARHAASHSQARGSERVPVDYTLRRYVRKIKGGPPGLVTYSNEKTVRVEGERREQGTVSTSKGT